MLVLQVHGLNGKTIRPVSDDRTRDEAIHLEYRLALPGLPWWVVVRHSVLGHSLLPTAAIWGPWDGARGKSAYAILTVVFRG